MKQMKIYVRMQLIMTVQVDNIMGNFKRNKKYNANWNELDCHYYVFPIYSQVEMSQLSKRKVSRQDG